MAMFRTADYHGLTLTGTDETRLAGVDGLVTVGWNFYQLLQLTEEVTPEVPEGLEDWEYDGGHYDPYSVLLKQPVLLKPEWMTDSCEDLCLAATELLLDPNVVQAAQDASLADNLAVSQEVSRDYRRIQRQRDLTPDEQVKFDRAEVFLKVTWGLLELRVLLARLAKLLTCPALDERLAQVDDQYSETGRLLVGVLDEFELMQKLLAIRSPASGKMSGWETLEGFEDVLDLSQWWGSFAVHEEDGDW